MIAWRLTFNRKCSLLIVIIISILGAAHARIAAPEYNVKAGYLLLFTQYVTWPDSSFTSADAPMVIAVLGTDPFGKVLDDTFKNISSQGHRIDVRRIQKAAQARQCHLVFISGLESARQAAWLDSLKHDPVFTVTETSDGIHMGAVVNFIFERESLRFEVNLQAMQIAGLKISSPMLVSALKVHHSAKGE